MKKFFTRILSMTLALALFGLIAPAQMVSAASTTASIKDSTFVFRNEKTDKCINNYGGNTTNGTKTTLWSYSKGDTDLWVRCLYRNGGYKIFDHELKIVIADVYRGSKTKASAKMKIDAWVDQKSEDAFQIWIFERQSNGSYILRLKFQQGLALGITKNQNGAQLQVVSYNKNDSSQRWFICGTDGKKLSKSQIEGSSSVASSQVTGQTRFIQSVEMVRTSLFSVAQSKYDAARTSLDVGVSFTKCTKYAELLGSNGTQAIKLCLNGWRLRYDQCIENVLDAAANCVNPDAYATVLALDLSRDAYDSGVQAFKTVSKYKNKKVTTYAEATEFYNAFLSCYANFEASLYITTPIVQTANRTSSGFAHTFKNLAKGIGHSILPDAGYGDEIISIFEGVNSIKEANEALGITNAYNKAYATAQKMFPAL